MFSQIFDKNNKVHIDCKKKKLFSDSELDFFHRLQKALPNCLIFPQLHLSSFIDFHINNEKKRHVMEKNIDQYLIDFGIFNQQLELLCVIELTTNTKDIDLTDEFSMGFYLTKSGIHSIKWNKEKLPTFDQMLRTLSPFSTLQAPKVVLIKEEPKPQNFEHLRTAASKPDVNISHLADHSNPDALSLKFLKDLTPDNYIEREYPHIWQRICLFAGEPSHLQNYLDSLFIQDRPVKRKGLPQNVANEVIAIQIENSKYANIYEESKDVWK
jgi:hypothetical protein